MSLKLELLPSDDDASPGLPHSSTLSHSFELDESMSVHDRLALELELASDRLDADSPLSLYVY